ncbi:MAG TPA: histidine kinase [Geobacter sp.]|nr:histidine kinase [Geobacter sp.]
MLKFGLKTRMTVSISLLTAGLLSILAVSTLVYFGNQIKQLNFTQQFAMVSAIAEQIDDRLATSQTELVATAGTLSKGVINNPAALRNFFAGRPDTLAMFDNGLFLFSAKGDLVSGNPLDPMIVGKNYAHRDYFKNTVTTQKPQISEPFTSAQTHGHPIIMLTAPILDKSGEVLAVLAGSIDLTRNNFLTRLGKIRLGERGYLYLFNTKRVMIVHPDGSRVFKQDVPVGANVVYDKAIGGFEGTGETVNSRKVPMISSFKKLKTTGWILAGNFPQSEAFAPITQAKRYVLIALVIVFLISVLVVSLSMNLLTAPLISFTQQIRTLAGKKGAMTAPLTVETDDEIGVLGEAFNHLLRELDEQKRELKRQLDFSQILIDIIPIPVFYKDNEGRYLGCNQAFLDFHGVSRNKFVGKTVYEVAPSELAAVYHRADLELASSGGMQVYETKAKMSDGRARDVMFFKTTFPAPDGACGGLLGVMLDITERKQAEVALQSQKEFAESLVMNSTVPTFVLDREHRVIIWNRALEALTGIKPAAVLGSKELWRIFYQTERPVLADMVLDGDLESIPKYYDNHQMSELISGGVQAQGRYRDPHGNWHYISISSAPIRDSEGELVGAIQIMEDITERKQAQDAHEKTRRQLQLILDAAGEGINGVDMDGRITFVNPAAAQMVGWTQEDLLGQNQHALMHHSKADGTLFPERECPISVACYSGIPQQGTDELFWRKDGTSFYVEYNCSPIREDGKLVGAVVIYKDMTERRQAEDQLLKLSQAVMQSPVSIMITDTSGTIEYVNPRFCQVSGYSAEEVIGQNPRLFKSGKTSPEHYKNMWETVTSGRVWSGEIYNRKKNGETHWEQATISPIRNSAGAISHYMAFKEDIADRKKLEEQLRQSQKMEAIGQLAGGVAHDFNNILTVILGFGQMLQQSLSEDDPRYEHMLQILEAADRATQLTKSLLAFSRKQVMLLQQVELNDLTRKHTKFLVRIIGEDVTLKTCLSQEPLPVMADSGQVEQVLMNLVANARDAMPGGGELWIKTESVQLDIEFYRQHGYGAPGRYALITVSDTGHGMNVATQQKIFEPFFTTKSPGRGTGLGLSIVYGIVKQHGGYVTISSQIGSGTTFSIYLPLLSEKVRLVEKSQSSLPSGGSETILVVEDDAAVGRLVESVLKRYGYQVILADSGEKALEYYDAKWSEISLALLDVIMPKMNGKQLCEELRRRTPTLKVLFLSGYTADLIKDKGIFMEGVDIMKKPAKPVELARKVREMLDA